LDTHKYVAAQVECHIVAQEQMITNQKGMARISFSGISPVQFLLEWILTNEMDAMAL